MKRSACEEKCASESNPKPRPKPKPSSADVAARDIASIGRTWGPRTNHSDLIFYGDPRTPAK